MENLKNQKSLDLEWETKNSMDWEKIHNSIFGKIKPESCKWTNIDDIINILNLIGKIKNSNHMFFPDGGGLDLEGAKKSFEPDCIEIDAGVKYILKPKSLTFENFNENYELNYFRLEADILKPSGVYDVSEEEIYSEEVCELYPSEYIDSMHWDANCYDGKPLPRNSRRITRIFKGALVIFKKTSIYNKDSSTYDGRHEKLGESGFKNYIKENILLFNGRI